MPHHDFGHREEHTQQRLQGLSAVVMASLTLQTATVHSHIPVGQLGYELHQSRHDGVQTIG